MNPQTLVSSFREALGSRLLEDRVIERHVGTIEPRPVYDIWLVIDRDALRPAVEHLIARFNPHISVISGDDLGENVAFNYHFTTGWGERFGEATCTLRVTVPKADFRLPTITDLLPGAQTTEREKHEFYGLEVEGSPDQRNLFLPEGFGAHPWRHDLDEETDKEVKRMVKWETHDE